MSSIFSFLPSTNQFNRIFHASMNLNIRWCRSSVPNFCNIWLYDENIPFSWINPEAPFSALIWNLPSQCNKNRSRRQILPHGTPYCTHPVHDLCPSEWSFHDLSNRIILKDWIKYHSSTLKSQSNMITCKLFQSLF